MLGKNCKIAAASGSDEPEAAKREMRKYHNIPTTVDGVRFASKKEAARYEQLKLMVRAKAITDLTLQPVFPISKSLGKRFVSTSLISSTQKTASGLSRMSKARQQQRPFIS